MSKAVLLFTRNIEQATAEIAALEGQITQQFTDIVFVANLPESVDPRTLKASTPNQPEALDQVSQLAVDAWNGLQDKTSRAAPSPTEGISWDTPGYTPPGYLDNDDSPSLFSDRSAQESTGTPTSLYMTGSVAVGVVIVSGTQSNLTFSNPEQQTVIQEVQEGLDFLANAEPQAKLTFVYDIRLITVSAAPGPTTTKESAEAPWRNAALQAMGLPGSRTGSVEYVQKLRQDKGTNWAYVAYFTKYPLQHFAYAGGERVVMHYDNDGWGSHNINRVFAHETCHIFGAADEYGSCACGGHHGYLSVPNNNCKNCPGNHEPCLMDANTLQICQWTRGQIGWNQQLFPLVFPPIAKAGIYTIQQKSSERFLDAHESSSQDYSVVTRPEQNNNSQRWVLTPVGAVYTIQQKSNNRFLDAHTSEDKDYSVVTRTAQNNNTQRWVAMNLENYLCTYTFQNLWNGRYLDAHTSADKDYSVVTRTAQNNNTQRWLLVPLGSGDYTIQQLSNHRFMDAHESSGQDYSVVTRPEQNNDTQRWTLTPVGGVYTIQQVINGRYLDAHTSADKDYSVVTRLGQHNDTQRWVILALGNHTYTIQQLYNGRHLDAHTSADKDYSVVTRPEQKNDTQAWIIKAP